MAVSPLAPGSCECASWLGRTLKVKKTTNPVCTLVPAQQRSLAARLLSLPRVGELLSVQGGASPISSVGGLSG